MGTMSARPDPSRTVAFAIFAVAAATIGGALVFEYGLGYVPCKLCLLQRTPFYVAMPLALAAAFVPARWGLRLGLACLALLFLASAGLGGFHAGVEWGFWPGPADCGGGSGAAPADVADFLKGLHGSRIVSCTEAAWRFLGLSLAGWNVLISLALAGLAALSLSREIGAGPALSRLRTSP